LIKLTQQTTDMETNLAELTIKKETPQVTLEELVTSMKTTADDVGQISELTTEEKLLVTEFFKSLLKFLAPLTKELSINAAYMPEEMGNVVSAHLDPTGHLAMVFADGHVELRNLCDENNRDLMIVVVQDAIPKLKQLTSAHKRKVENRIKFLSAVTKEIQKIAGALSSVNSAS
jgi:prepilin-type processing-associated H-X9-DG protein